MEKKVDGISYEGGIMVVRPYEDAANGDWIRATRLAKAKKAGDKKAAAELARLEGEKMMQEDEK